MIAWLTCALAQTPEGDFPPARTDLGDGVWVDWTTGHVRASGTARRLGSEGTQAIEELARRKVDDKVRASVLAVAVAPGRALGDLAASPELWPGVETRLGRWVETENRYYSSGRVEVIGALSLVEVLKALTMASARPRVGEPGEYTGALLDARGTGARPCFAPVVVDADERVLYEGRLWLEAAVSELPVVWVGDAADPAAQRAGDKPLAGAVSRAEGCRLGLDGALAEQFEALARSATLGSARLVVVVDP